MKNFKCDWDNEKDRLYDLVINKKQSLKSVGRLYNCTGTTIKHAIERCFNIKLPLITNQYRNSSRKRLSLYCINCGKNITKKRYRGRLYCNKKCMDEYRNNTYINKWKSGEIDGTISNKVDLSDYIRNYLLKKVEYKCELCGWNIVNKYTGVCPLHIYHKDGNALNNKEENLQVLCPNCHSLTENYGSRNKNACRQRSTYHMAKWKKELYNR